MQMSSSMLNLYFGVSSGDIVFFCLCIKNVSISYTRRSFATQTSEFCLNSFCARKILVVSTCRVREKMTSGVRFPSGCPLEGREASIAHGTTRIEGYSVE